MTPNEAIIELQNTYDKKLTNFQVTRYTRFLAKFTPADVARLVEKAVESERYLPRIAQLDDAAADLLILKPDRTNRGDKGCPVCSGSGWEFVTVNNDYTKNQDVRAVKPCYCRQTPPISDSDEVPF